MPRTLANAEQALANAINAPAEAMLGSDCCQDGWVAVAAKGVSAAGLLGGILGGTSGASLLGSLTGGTSVVTGLLGGLTVGTGGLGGLRGGLTAGAGFSLAWIQVASWARWETWARWEATSARF